MNAHRLSEAQRSLGHAERLLASIRRGDLPLADVRVVRNALRDTERWLDVAGDQHTPGEGTCATCGDEADDVAGVETVLFECGACRGERDRVIS